MLYSTMGPHFEPRLYDILVDGLIDWKGFSELKLWVLITFSVNVNSSRRAPFIAPIVQVIGVLHLETRDAIVDILEGFLWLEDVVSVNWAVLKEKILRSGIAIN